MAIDLILGALLWYDDDKDDSDDVFAYQELIHDLDDNDNDDEGYVHDDGDDHQELVHDLDDPLQPLLDLLDRSAHLSLEKSLTPEFNQNCNLFGIWTKIVCRTFLMACSGGISGLGSSFIGGPLISPLVDQYLDLSGRCVKL